MTLLLIYLAVQSIGHGIALVVAVIEISKIDM